jgi:hypothetical protein
MLAECYAKYNEWNADLRNTALDKHKHKKK